MFFFFEVFDLSYFDTTKNRDIQLIKKQNQNKKTKTKSFSIKMPTIAVTYNATVGGVSVISLKKAFQTVGCHVVDADYRLCATGVHSDVFERPELDRKIWSLLKEKAKFLLQDVHCLVLSGSNAMIDPQLFNQQREYDKKYDFSRVMSELAFIHIAVNKGMPILGICAGHQLISVYFGGTLKNLNTQELIQQNFHGDDVIYFRSGCFLTQLIGQDAQSFFGSHRQVVDKLGNGLETCGIASDYHSNEAFESKYGAPIICTQFHPEVSVHGFENTLPNLSARKSSIDIFEFIKGAAETYRQKLIVLNSLKTVRLQESNMTPFWKQLVKFCFGFWIVLVYLCKRWVHNRKTKNYQETTSNNLSSPFFMFNNS